MIHATYTMLRKGFFTFALFAFGAGAFAQSTLVLEIRDAQTNKHIPFAKINPAKTNTTFFADSGFYVWNLLAIPSLKVSAWNYSDTVLFAKDYPNNDTLRLFLKSQPEQLNEVLVNPKNSWLQNKIYGFERWQTPTSWGWAFLMEKELFVANQKLDLLYKTILPKVGGKTPKAMYQDVLGNNYLLGKDSVQQVYITDTTIYVYPQRAENVFNAQIKPLLAEVENGLIYRETNEVDYDINYLMRETGTYFEFNIKHPPLHNCGAQIVFKKEEKAQLIYACVDTGAYRAASDAFARYIGYHIKFWYVHEDSGYFSGAIKRAMGMSLNSYQHLFAQYRHVYFMPVSKKHIIFDPYSKQLITFNQGLKAIKEEPFSFSDCPREEYLYTDQATGQWWLQRRKRGLDVLESVRPGDPPQSITLDPFVKNIRVHGNVVFYINELGEFRVKKIE